ncbi:MAG: putative dehydrogenase [Planctomycetota bacterium]|jgi:predicted dehydrogenase
MITRRSLLRTGATIGAASLLPRSSHALGRARPGLDDKLKLGIVGVANRAASNLAGVSGEQIVALCDIDSNYLNKVATAHPGAVLYRDFRAMLAAEKLDAVVVSTADHTHAPATLMALEQGLDVYCEKPLTHSVAEARLVAETARRKGAVTQMGTQIHSGANYRRVVELVRSGAIGSVRECHAWVGKAWGGGERPTDTPPVPEHLAYDLWLGPAPERPYHPTYLPANWRRWWDFGGGTLGDMGCHLLDLAFWALELRHPVHVSAEGPPVHLETAPTWMRANWEFAARKGAALAQSEEVRVLPAVSLHWHDGGALPPQMEAGTVPKWGSGVLFVGDKGMLLADYGRIQLLPDDKFKNHAAPTPWIADSIGHYQEWIQACKARTETTCNFDYSGALTETVLLGNVAYRSGAKFDWDAASMKASTEQAQQFIGREYRDGWD